MSKVKSRSTKKKNSKKKKAKFNLKVFLKSTFFLKTVFIFLLFLVIILAFFVYKKNQEVEDIPEANLVIPIKDYDTEYSFAIELPSLAVEKEYVFKITNFRNDEVNAEEVYYDVSITNPTESIISVTKDSNNKRVVSADETSVFENIKLEDSDLDQDYYYVTIENLKKLESDDRILITITGRKN